VVKEAQIVETVPEAVRAIEKTGTKATTTISGPSATSDIEMTRIKGVHGPRTLEVIIVQ
jgi:L-lactate dehydrogenase complex protein LldG